MNHSHHGHSDHNMNHDIISTTTTTGSPMSDHEHGHHESMDIINDSQTGHHNMMMHMYFHGGDNETILFEFWRISETGGLIASMFAIFFLAFVYEALKFYREHLYRHSFQTVQVDTVAVPVENGGSIKETHKTVQIATTSTSHNPYAPEINPIFISQINCTCPSPENPEVKVQESEISLNNNDGVPLTCSPPSPLKRSRSIHYKVKMLSLMHIWQTCLHVLQVILSYFLMLIFMTYNIWLCLAVAVGAGSGYFFFGWKKSLVVDITEHCH